MERKFECEYIEMTKNEEKTAIKLLLNIVQEIIKENNKKANDDGKECDITLVWEAKYAKECENKLNNHKKIK